MNGNGVKQQEYQFVEWSMNVSSEDFDVKAMLASIRVDEAKRPVRVADIGGGVGSVAKVLCERMSNISVDVIESSALARDAFQSHPRSKLVFADFFSCHFDKPYDFVILRTVLHHFVGASDSETESLQRRALDIVRSKMLADGGTIFVIENFYEPFFGEDLTGRMIYEATRLKWPRHIFRALGANTAGEGVRFRSSKGWGRIFTEAGLQESGVRITDRWSMPLWQKIPFLCSARHQSLVSLVRS